MVPLPPAIPHPSAIVVETKSTLVAEHYSPWLALGFRLDHLVKNFHSPSIRIVLLLLCQRLYSQRWTIQYLEGIPPHRYRLPCEPRLKFAVDHRLHLRVCYSRIGEPIRLDIGSDLWS